MNIFEEFDYLKNSSECSTVSASKTSSSSSSVEDVDSSQQLNAIPTQSSNRNKRITCEIYSELTVKAAERRQWRRSDVFIINF